MGALAPLAKTVSLEPPQKCPMEIFLRMPMIVGVVVVISSDLLYSTSHGAIVSPPFWGVDTNSR